MPKRKIEEPLLVDFSLLKLAGFGKAQIHVIHYLQQGFTIEEIARVLGRSRGTVNYHLGNIGKRLNARGMAEIMARAIITTYELSTPCKGCSAVKKGRRELPLM